MFNSTVAWDVTNGSTPFLTPLEKKYIPAIEKNKLTIVLFKSSDIESYPVGAGLTSKASSLNHRKTKLCCLI